jgi:hypothetical protein
MTLTRLFAVAVLTMLRAAPVLAQDTVKVAAGQRGSRDATRRGGRAAGARSFVAGLASMQ